MEVGFTLGKSLTLGRTSVEKRTFLLFSYENTHKVNYLSLGVTPAKKGDLRGFRSYIGSKVIMESSR